VKARASEVANALREKVEEAESLMAEARQKAEEARKAEAAASECEREVARLKDYNNQNERDVQSASLEAAKLAKDAVVAKQEAQTHRAALAKKVEIQDDEL